MSTQTDPQHSTGQQWLAVIALAFAAFIVNTTEFIPVALLSDIGQSFDMPSTDVGIMITLYAWVVAPMSLPIMLLTKNMERRFLLIALFVLFIASHVLSYFAWSFNVLLISRVGIALAHALFWSITASLAIRVAPEGKQFQALGLLSMGTSMAMVLGVPLGHVIGDYAGWRNCFALITLCAIAVTLILAKSLPKLPSQNAGNLSSLKLFMQRPALLLAFALTVLMVTAQFIVYSYIEPFNAQVAQLNSAQISQFLFIYGAAGFLGSYLFGYFTPRFPKLIIPVCCVSLVICMLLLLPLASQVFGMMTIALYWGASMICLSLALRAKILDLSSDATDVAMAIFSALYNVGIGGGALIGASVAQHLGLGYIGWIGAGVGLIGTLLTLYLLRQQSPSQKN